MSKDKKIKYERLIQGRKTRERILGYIVSYIEEHKIPPTLREISEGVGISTTSVTTYHLQRLEKDGLIERDPNISRGLRLPGSALDQFDLEYRCHYPFGCSSWSKKPGRCIIHATEFVLFVSRRSR